MRRYAQRSIRPLIYVSVVLLFLSLAAPWKWQSITVGPTPAEIPLPPRLTEEDLDQSVLYRSIEPIMPEVEPVVPQIQWRPEAAQIALRPGSELQEFNVSPLVAEIAGPVTELIALDPSLSETTDLPPRRTPPRSEPPPDSLTPDDLEAPLPLPMQRPPVAPPPKLGGLWPHAESLERQLHALAEESPADFPWVQKVLAELDSLAAEETLTSEGVNSALKNLRSLLQEIPDESLPQPPRRDRTLRLRVGYAMLRRLAVWEGVYQVATFDLPSSRSIAQQQLAAALQGIDKVLGQSTAAPAWNDFLRLADLRTVAGQGGETTAAHRELARDVLRRLDSPRLNHAQHDFLSAAPFMDLARVLLPAAQDVLDWGGLLEAIEQHESLDTSESNSRIAEMYQVLRWSTHERSRQLATQLNENYRNANVRLALSEELLNRFIPPPQVMAEPVADNVRGADVYGRSQSVARLRVVLVPDRLRWTLGLEARGSIASETESAKGPARFWNDGVGEFHARKVVTLDRRGMSIARTHTKAQAESFLKNFETDYDPIPLFGSLARAIAQRQYQEEMPAARYEIEAKISQKASQRLDQEIDQRILQAEQEFQAKLISPLDRLNLEPTPVDLHTTSRRLIARYRLAGSSQLSAHTPRPQAPGNSLVSLQLHQSMFNNTLENLKLADRKVGLRDLYVEMLQQFQAKEINIPEDLPEDVTIHFAEVDPVRIHCEDGRVQLTIRLKELDHAGRNVWRNFEVRGYYRPSDNQIEANLVRDGNIELVGERLKLGDQIALRGIFAKVLSRNRQLSIVNKQLLARPQLSDLQVTQFVVQDSWIGVALGPKSDNMRPAPTPDEDESTEVSQHPRRLEIFQRMR